MSLIVFILNKQKNNCDKGFVLLPTFFTRTRSVWLVLMWEMIYRCTRSVI